jgi:hypothetical protein
MYTDRLASLRTLRMKMSQGLSELKAMEAAYAALEPLEPVARHRATQWLVNALDVSDQASRPTVLPEESGARYAQKEGVAHSPLSQQGSIPTPKEFISDKRPRAVAERVACLAYYLTHFRDTKEFSSAEIAGLNTEAASPKINPARDVDNADRSSGYLVSAGNRKKQITTRGEKLVLALPDRTAVDAVLAEYPHRKRKASSSTRKSSASNGDGE